MVVSILVAAALIAIAIALEERTGLLAPGDEAPDFTATLGDGKRIELKDYRGKNPVVLFFYPGDFTMGCTREACAFRDVYADLRASGALLFGISRDSAGSHGRFSENYHLPYPLISDPAGAIGKAYGIDRLGGLFGLPKRVTYVIDTDGVVRAVIHHEIQMQRHIDDVRQALEMMKGRRQL